MSQLHNLVSLGWGSIAVATVLLFAFSLPGCQSRAELTTDIPNEKPVATETTAQVSFTVLFNDLNTLKFYPTEPEEKLRRRLSFNGIRIVLYAVDKDTQKPTTVAYVFNKRVKAEEGEVTGADFTSSQPAINAKGWELTLSGKHTIDYGDYEIYLFATPSKSIIDATEVGMPFSELQKTFSIEDLYEHYHLPYSLYATQKPVQLRKSDLDEATGNTINIQVPNLSPLNALVSVSWSPTLVNLENYIIAKERMGIKADVMNKKVKLFPNNSPEMQSLGLYYPEDANYSNWASKSEEELKEEFVYTPEQNKWPTSVVDHYSRLLPNRSYDSYLVVPENTMSPDELNGKVVTRLIVWAFIRPKFEGEADAGPKSRYNDGWVLFAGKGYQTEQFQNLFKAAKAKDDPTDTEKMILQAGKELNAFSKVGEEASEITFPEEGFDGEWVKYYYKSINYYSFPMTHYTLEQLGNDPKKPGRLGVVRGTHYHYNVQSFSEIGVPTVNSLARDIDYSKVRTVSFPTSQFDDFAEIISDINF